MHHLIIDSFRVSHLSIAKFLQLSLLVHDCATVNGGLEVQRRGVLQVLKSTVSIVTVSGSHPAAPDSSSTEDDLAAMRAEAIQSAIATASNLTQWAAGAVRRALAQHSRASDLSSMEAKQPVDQDVIDLSQADSADKEISTSMTISDDTADAQNEAQDADDRLLQQAIKESIENAKQAASKDASN